MNISLSPELEQRIAQRVARGDVDSADALVAHALTFYLEYEGGDIDEEETRQTQSAIGEALEQTQRGVSPTCPDKATTRQMTLESNACFHLTTWSFVPRIPKSGPRYAPLMRQLSGVQTRLT